MNEYLIITGVNAPANPGNNVYLNLPIAVSGFPAFLIPWPYNLSIVLVDRFMFRTNGEYPAKINFYTFSN